MFDPAPAETMLDKLKRRIPGATDEKLLQDMLDDAKAILLPCMGLKALPAGTESLQLRIATACYNALGLEGQTSHSEGGVSVSLDMLPPALQREINGYRVAKVGW